MTKSSLWKSAGRIRSCDAVGDGCHLQLEWSAISPDPSPIENPWDELSCHVDASNSAPQNLYDLRAALKEQREVDLRTARHVLVGAIIDARGHVMRS